MLPALLAHGRLYNNNNIGLHGWHTGLVIHRRWLSTEPGHLAHVRCMLA